MAQILIVDDEPDIRFLLKMILQSAGYEVIEANHGVAALERVAEARPDLVVTDMMMPLMDGRGLIERLRSDPQTASIPILVVTAHANATAGDAMLNKRTLRPRELLETTESLIERQA